MTARRRGGCDLAKRFGRLAGQVPTDEEGAHRFRASGLPRPPRRMASDRLIIVKGDKAYDDEWRADWLIVQASRATYRELGLLILSVVLRDDTPSVQLALTHPGSAIKTLEVEYDVRARSRWSGYRTRPLCFNYRVTVLHHKWPFANGFAEPDDLPVFTLTCAPGRVLSSDQDWRQRDTIRGFGDDHQAVRLAELLLNFGRPEAALQELDLESEAGVRGVGPRSAEVRFEVAG